MKTGPVLLGLTLSVAIACIAKAEDRVVFERNSDKPGANVIQYNKHDISFAWDAIEELTGKRPSAKATRADLASATLDYLDTLPRYGQKATARVEPAIPEWFLDGYKAFTPSTVSKSRYLSGVMAGSLQAEPDTAALYAFWCMYDAEWFAISRKPAYKAWLSAVALTYPPQWIALRESGATEVSLKARLQAPLQTPDEPYREIGNWINAFTKLNDDRDNPSGEGGAFAKPKVRSALVAELIERGGVDYDARLTEDRAYEGAPPAALGLSEREFFLLAALSVEFFQEVYEQDPQTKQPLWIRDYFVSAFQARK